MRKLSEKKRFSIIARARSFNFAWRGLKIIAKTQHNFWVQVAAAVFVVLLGFEYDINQTEWAILILAMTAVFAAESFNTAFEIDIDLTSPDEHPYARDTKDVAAGAVLLTVLGATIIGLIIFIPKVFS